MKKFTIALIGNPNAGKTTLFNALTGSHQRVGNWPGVTVDKKTGYFEIGEYHVEIVDLPGIYSLSTLDEASAIDEKIAVEYLLEDEADLIVNVLDANNLERNLYLTTQLLELNKPTILAVNMSDIAKKRGIKVDIKQLEKELDCPTLPLISSRRHGIAELEIAIINTWNNKQPDNIKVKYPPALSNQIGELANQIKNKYAYFTAIRLLEEDATISKHVKPKITAQVTAIQNKMTNELNEDADILIADARYGMIHKIVQTAVKTTAIKTTVTTAIDRVILNRVLGIPIFLGVMYLMFMFAINIGGAFQDFFQIGSDAIFVHGLAHLLVSWHFPPWLIMLLSSGAGKGINTTLTFIPVLAAMFFFLAVLESTGYMARAGFVVDRLMCAIGLPGKSFVPMLIGFGCNVPAIMATRTLDNQRDRILTIMMTPFMSCGARLAIYAVFTAAFFPKGGQNIVFILYLTGILVAVITGLILRKTLLQGEQSSLVMELPPYHLPTLRNITIQSWHRLKSFIIKAGKIIIPVCIIVSALNTFNTDGSINFNHPSKHSVLATIGRTITPVLKPIGIQQNNWPATVGLVTGIMAKEVVVGTLNTLYNEFSGTKTTRKETYSFTAELKTALLSIKQNLQSFITDLGNPINIKSTTNQINGVYGKMYKRFNGPIGAFAYLLFVLLYFPCIPAIATIFKELNWRWATFSMFWNTGIAYFVATLFYQVATFTKDPAAASFWIILMLSIFLSTVLIMRFHSKNMLPKEQ
ncbi:MAG: Fe(2+) transporter permease subunit FeoB [Gammaproteobacteria bacterium]|nr:Fe(2+) transporter permease subunit FeoB [Gammaproteobacteria bacterium]